MLFRNLKSGNIVAATDKTSVELMQRSAIYEIVEIAPAVAPTPAKAEGKRRKKPTEAETDAPAAEVETDAPAAEAETDAPAAEVQED